MKVIAFDFYSHIVINFHHLFLMVKLWRQHWLWLPGTSSPVCVWRLARNKPVRACQWAVSPPRPHSTSDALLWTLPPAARWGLAYMRKFEFRSAQFTPKLTPDRIEVTLLPLSTRPGFKSKVSNGTAPGATPDTARENNYAGAISPLQITSVLQSSILSKHFIQSWSTASTKKWTTCYIASDSYTFILIWL